MILTSRRAPRLPSSLVKCFINNVSAWFHRLLDRREERTVQEAEDRHQIEFAIRQLWIDLKILLTHRDPHRIAPRQVLRLRQSIGQHVDRQHVITLHRQIHRIAPAAAGDVQC